MREPWHEGPAGLGGVPPRIFGTALISGILLACLVASAARLETGDPPGVTPRPFARLLVQPAPAFVLDGLHAAPVSTGDAPPRRSWLVFLADAAYPALERVPAPVERRN